MVLLKELLEKVYFEFFLEKNKKSFPSNPHAIRVKIQRENC